MTQGMEYFYNLSTGSVEEGRQSPGSDLMGPYGSREEAQQALSTAAARNKEWDEDDKSWDGDEESSAPSA